MAQKRRTPTPKFRCFSSQQLFAFHVEICGYGFHPLVTPWVFFGRQVTVNAVMQLYTRDVDCSDKRDGALEPIEDTHSAPLSQTSHVASHMPDDHCSIIGKTYCDNTETSGRQLDLCMHCGGSCLPPLCSKDHCIDRNEMLAQICFNVDFPGGTVTKLFEFGGLSAANAACPSPTGPEVHCEGYRCNFENKCAGRLETYRVGTHQLRVMAGEPYVFSPNSLTFDSLQRGRVMRVRVRLLAQPNAMLHGSVRMASHGDEGGGTLAISTNLSQAIADAPAAGSSVIPDGSFLYAGQNLTIVEIGETRFEFVTNDTAIDDVLAGLSLTPDAHLGRSVSTHQLLLRIELQLVRDDGSAYSFENWNVEASTASRGIFPCEPFGPSCGCKVGFTGPACDMFERFFDLSLVVEPPTARLGERVVQPSKGAGSGRRATLSRGGHGTHIVSSALGRAFGLGSAEASVQDGLASGAQLAFIDISLSGSPYLTPPEDLRDGLLKRLYDEAGARVSLNPWTCEDTMWWRKQEQAFESAAAVARDPALRENPSICNRYTTSAWEVDSFVATHQDMFVVFPAGDGDALNSVASPGTCKNCITVGASQGWHDDLQAGARMLRRQCRPEDCPVYVDQSDTCAHVNFTSPHALPGCCSDKYAWDGAYYSPTTLHTTARGLGVSQQAPSDSKGRSAYQISEGLRFARFKPEVVAPGLNIIAGRSDGDTSGVSSRGTRGCRCCTDAGGSADQACLAALSGSSVAAAKVAALGAVTRQYFSEGYYPSGISQFSAPHPASAALIKAILIASGDPLDAVTLSTGGAVDVSSLSMPNRFTGFGLVHLRNVLKITRPKANDIEITPASTACSCSGNNTQLIADAAGRARFGEDFGTTCAPWMAMPNSKQRCDRLFSAAPRARPHPGDELQVRDFDASCCKSFCLVDASCPSARPWAEFPGLYYSFDICADDKATRESCEWRDQAQGRDIRTLAFDHSITRDSPDGVPYPFEDSSGALKHSIAAGETFRFMFTIEGASTVQPFVVALVYTDPVGAPGATDVLVNDLDLSVQLTELEPLALGANTSLAGRKEKPGASLLLWGNGKQGGDRFNNVERVRVEAANASRVVVSVMAWRLSVGLDTSPCQPFALVMTGALDEEALGSRPPVLAIEPEMTPGICGRPPAVTPPPPPPLSTVDIIGIAVGSGIGALLFCTLVFWLMVRRAMRINKTLADNTHGSNLGYLSAVDKVEREEGIAEDGGPDFIIFGEQCSAEDGFYVGLPIILLEGEGEGESSVITAYDGRIRKASCEWELGGPRNGTRYVIAHESGIGLGYKIGDAGYIPISALPKPGQDNLSELYGKQYHALERARENYGGLTDRDLDMLKIGRFRRTMTKTEKMQAVHAGILIKAPVSSKDIFLYSVKQATEEGTSTLTTAKEVQKESYIATRGAPIPSCLATLPPRPPRPFSGRRLIRASTSQRQPSWLPAIWGSREPFWARMCWTSRPETAPRRFVLSLPKTASLA